MESIFISKICSPNTGVISVKNCPESAKYCISGACTSNQPSSCVVAPTSSNLCPSQGLFPSPTACNRYVVCDNRRVATEYICPHPYVYFQNKGLCGRLYDLNDCPAINCNANKNEFVVYKPVPRLYYFCSERGPVLLQCNYGQAFYNDSQSCEFECTREGRFPHDTDDSKYYYCLYNNNYSQFNRFVETCPEGQVFSRGLSVCVFQQKTYNETETATETSSTTYTYTTTGTWY